MIESEWREYTPGWECGDGLDVEVQLKDGTVKRTRLEVVDSSLPEEPGDESYPVYVFELEDGKQFELYEVERWREIRS